MQLLWNRNDLLAVPRKLAACGKQIDYRSCPRWIEGRREDAAQ